MSYTDKWSNMAIPAPNCWSGCPNPQGIFYQPLMQGLPCPPSHPNQQMPPCAPPPPPNPNLPGITTVFTGNMTSGFNSFGCSFLMRRELIQEVKLRLLQNSINPNSSLGQQLEPLMINWSPGTPTPPPTPSPNNPVPVGSAPMNTTWANIQGSGSRATSPGGRLSGGETKGSWRKCDCPDGSSYHCMDNLIKYPGTNASDNCCTRGYAVFCTGSEERTSGSGVSNFGGDWSYLAPPTNLPQAPTQNVAVPTGPTFTTPIMPSPVNTLSAQANSIMMAPIQPAGSVGINSNWQQMLQNRISWIGNFIQQNCTGGPTPPPPPGPPMVTCSQCVAGQPQSQQFPMQPPGGGPSCPPGWTGGNTNPCGGVTGGTPPPPGYGTGGGIINNGFTSF